MSAKLTVLGVQQKPSTCRNLCPYFMVGSGYVEDFSPTNPKVCFLIPSPSGDDCINRRPLSSAAGASFRKKYIESLGYTQDDYMVASVLRCRPKGDGSKKARHGQYPTGSARKGAEAACRYYDRMGPLEKFNPDCYVITFELSTVYQEPAFTRLLARDIQKSFDLAAKGYRPIVLMGNPAAELLAKYIVGNGGVKSWRGEWRTIPSWPWLEGSTELPATSTRFIAA